MGKKKESLDLEANKLNYRLRSTFFLRKIREYSSLKFSSILQDILSVASSYSWDHRSLWCIDEESFKLIKALGIDPIEVFCHPKVILEFPMLIAYYRNVAALSQKATKYLTGIEPKRWEIDESKKRRKIPPITSIVSLKLACLFNEHISLIVESSVRHPRQSRWLDEWGRLKGGRPG